MGFRKYASASLAPSLLPLATVVLAIGIFVVDTITDLEIAVAVLYVTVVLISVRFCRRRGVILVSATCMILTILSYLLTTTGSPSAGLINCGISLLAIAATAFLILRIKAAEVIAHEARAQLAHMARTTTLGEMTASITHEVSQPLAAIMTSANACKHWLANQPPNIEKVGQAVDRIAKDANRAGEVIGRVRNLVRRTPPRMVSLNINEVIQEVAALTEAEINKKQISFRAQLAGNIPLVRGDRIQLQQVILNLIINAIEAIATAGGVARDLFVCSAIEESGGILVAVRDSGVSVNPDKLDQVFEAFYTTKDGGMGMGLTICRSIIEAHGGRLWMTPNSPRGVLVQFILPSSEKVAQ